MHLIIRNFSWTPIKSLPTRNFGRAKKVSGSQILLKHNHTTPSSLSIFSDGRNKFWHIMEVEHCIGADGEEIRNFLHRIRKTVQRLACRYGWSRIGWPGCWTRRTSPAEKTEIHWLHTKRLRAGCLQRNAQEYLMEHPNSTWNDFATHLIKKDVSYPVSTSFLNDEEQNKAQMASLGQELKNLRIELKEHRVNALEGNQKPIDPNQKERQNASRFCGHCRTNGHTPSFCRKKIRDEEVRKLQNEATAEKKVTFTHDYNKSRGPSRRSGKWTSRNDDNEAMMSIPQHDTRGKIRASNQSYNDFSRNRPFERRPI